jgi:hypothetical protein
METSSSALMAMADAMSAFWDGPFGAVREDDRPSWLMVDP